LLYAVLSGRIYLQGTFDNLVNGFFFETSMLYEISTSYFAVGNVYANGRGTDMTLELMYGAAYGNLFTNIHLGAGTKPFGWVTRGQDAAGFNTFWNIRTANDQLALPPATWAPRVLFVNAEGAPVVGSVLAAHACEGPDGNHVFCGPQHPTACSLSSCMLYLNTHTRRWCCYAHVVSCAPLNPSSSSCHAMRELLVYTACS
jgi:hypothetical protein